MRQPRSGDGDLPLMSDDGPLPRLPGIMQGEMHLVVFAAFFFLSLVP